MKRACRVPTAGSRSHHNPASALWACTHSPLWSLLGAPSEAPPSSGGLPAASGPETSPGVKLPFRVRMIGDLVVGVSKRSPRSTTHPPTGSMWLHGAKVPGVAGDIRLEVVAHVGLLASLQLTHVRCVLLARVIEFAALTQHLEVHGQRRRLHVHQLVVGDGGLGGFVPVKGWATPTAMPHIKSLPQSSALSQ